MSRSDDDMDEAPSAPDHEPPSAVARLVAATARTEAVEVRLAEALARADKAEASQRAEAERASTLVEAARRIVAAADACDREAERHPSSRSSAPVVRSINAMAALRAALDALDAPTGGTP